MRRVCLAAIVTLALACTGGEETLGGRLVIIGGGGSLTVVDPVGGEPEILSEGSAAPIPVQATASPDGNTLVWSEVTPDGRAVVKIRDESGTRELDSPTVPYYYAFAPGGITMAALGNDPAGAGVALLIIDLGNDRVDLVDVGQPYYLDWSPDGARLAVHIGADFVGLVDHDGQRRRLAVRPGPFLAPAWTDDGRIVAVLATEEVTASAVALQTTSLSLAIVDPDDGSVELIDQVSEAVAFEVAGDRLAVVDGSSLRVVDLDGSGSVAVADVGVVTFEWSPDGTALLFHTLDGASFVPHVWDGEEVTDYPGFLPTPRMLAEYFPFWSQYIRTITQWSPDSAAFAYAAGGEDEEGTVWIQPRDGEASEVGPGEMVIWTP